jgi:hypothetical protein
MPKLPKHHYIPIFYLKQWAGEDGMLCEFSRPFDKVVPRMKHPSGTGYERGIYTFDLLPPAAAEYLERHFFEHADNGASDALRLLVAGKIGDLDGRTKCAWSRFIMTLMHRTPERVEWVKARVLALVPEALERARQQYPSMRGPGDPATFDEFRASMSPDAPQRATIMCLQRIMDSELVGNALNQMLWAVTPTHRARHTLLTCDRPIVMTNGLARPDAHIVLPISPLRIFFAAKNDETMRALDAMWRRGALAASLNDYMARQAHKYVYSTDDRQLRFVANRFGERLKSSPFEEETLSADSQRPPGDHASHSASLSAP